MKSLKIIAAVLLAGSVGNFILHAGDFTPEKNLPLAKQQGGSPTNVSTETPKGQTELPTITPNGVMTIFGKKQVLFKVANAAQSGETTSDLSYVLEEGEGRNGVKVVAIDYESKIVTFNNHGIIQKITLKTAVLPSLAPSVQSPITVQSEANFVSPPPMRKNNNLGGVSVITIGSRQTAPAVGFKHKIGLATQNVGGETGGINFSPPPLSRNAGVVSQPNQPVSTPVEVVNQQHQPVPPPTVAPTLTAPTPQQEVFHSPPPMQNVGNAGPPGGAQLSAPPGLSTGVSKH